MFVYAKLERKIATMQPTTITVDIFDTVLMRRGGAEQWRFWKFAKQAARVIDCSPLLYYSLRNYFGPLQRAANLELGHDHESSLDTINSSILDELVRRQNTKITKAQKLKLCKILAQCELELEREQLFANKKLIRLLAATKLPVYFNSDMYLSSAQIEQLLAKFGLKYSGVSSSDHLHGKSSGRSFARLEEKFARVIPATNLHIGDHRHADVAMPQSLGINAFWLNLPWHRLRLLLAKYVFAVLVKLLVWKSIRHDYLKATSKFYKHLEGPSNLGKIFAPAVIYYTHYLCSFAVAKDARPIFVSSESDALASFAKLLGIAKTSMLPSFSRRRLLQSYCYLQHSKGVPYIAMLPMIKKVLRRKTTTDALATLGLDSESLSSYKLLGKKAFFARLESDRTILTNSLKKTYLDTLKQFRSAAKTNNLAKVILADVGWNSTIQILLGETLKANKYQGELSGLYLGLSGTNIFSGEIIPKSRGVIFNSLKGVDKYLYQPEVWESFLNLDNLGNATRESIIEGINSSVADYNNSNLSPLDFYRASHSQLLKILAAPPKQIIITLSRLKFDYGVGNELPVPLINVSHPWYYAYKLLLIDRAGFKKFYYQQGWKWGAARWYRFRLIYRLWRYKTHKPSL